MCESMKNMEGNEWNGCWLQRAKERQGGAERWGGNVILNVNLQMKQETKDQ